MDNITLDKIKIKIEILKLMADDYNWCCQVPKQVRLELCNILGNINKDDGISSYLLMTDIGDPSRFFYDKEQAMESLANHSQIYKKAHIIFFEPVVYI